MVRNAIRIGLVMPIISNVYLMKLSDNKFDVHTMYRTLAGITFQMMLSIFVGFNAIHRMDHPID